MPFKMPCNRPDQTQVLHSIPIPNPYPNPYPKRWRIKFV